MTSSIPDFLRAHNPENVQKQPESILEPQIEKATQFIPTLDESNIPSSDNPKDIDLSGDEENIPQVATPEFLETEEISEKEGDALKRRLPKGSKPPVLTLLEAVSVITDIYELAGGNVSLDALSQIVRNSRSSSTFSKKLTALRGYGLVEIENQDVRLSELGNRIVAAKSPAMKVKAIKEAFISVDVFARIYKQLCGKILPQDEYLVNFFTDFVPKDFSISWMERFKDSAAYAGVLLDRGDGKFQVIEDVAVNQPTSPTAEKDDEAEKNSSVEVERKESEKNNLNGNENIPPPPSTHEKAIKTIILDDSQKSIWLGSDANILEIKFGKDMDFVLALIKLFDLYEKKKDFKVVEGGDDKRAD